MPEFIKIASLTVKIEDVINIEIVSDTVYVRYYTIMISEKKQQQLKSIVCNSRKDAVLLYEETVKKLTKNGTHV